MYRCSRYNSAWTDGGETFQWKKAFFEVKGALVSCIKKCEERDSVIMRLYNVETGTKKAQIRFALPIKEAYLVNMKEETAGAAFL